MCEHCRNTVKKNNSQSQVAKHANSQSPTHDIDFEGVEILSVVRDPTLREIQEGLYIQQSEDNLMNVKPGFSLSSTWLPIVPKLHK